MAETQDVPLPPNPLRPCIDWTGAELETIRAYGDARVKAADQRVKALRDLLDERESDIGRLTARIRELEAERDALRADAERLIDAALDSDACGRPHLILGELALALRAAIDQARGKP